MRRCAMSPRCCSRTYDGFGVILAQTNQEQANAKAAALAQAIGSTALRWGKTDIKVSAAYGVYSFTGSDDAQVAIEAADKAMYRQKRSDKPVEHATQ
jgi:PleD family two-component response regulator